MCRHSHSYCHPGSTILSSGRWCQPTPSTLAQQPSHRVKGRNKRHFWNTRPTEVTEWHKDTVTFLDDRGPQADMRADVSDSVTYIISASIAAQLWSSAGKKSLGCSRGCFLSILGARAGLGSRELTKRREVNDRDSQHRCSTFMGRSSLPSTRPTDGNMPDAWRCRVRIVGWPR